jgi:hypothetical protein
VAGKNVIFGSKKPKSDRLLASYVSHESERPIKMVWQLDHPMPAEMFENCRKGG